MKLFSTLSVGKEAKAALLADLEEGAVADLGFLGLSVRAINELERQSIVWIRELLEHGFDDICRDCRRLGVGTVRDFKRAIRSYHKLEEAKEDRARLGFTLKEF